MTILLLALLIILSIAFIALLIFMFCTILYILPMVRGAVYVPSKPEAIQAMIELADLGPGVKVADLGSGDGRVVIALAQTGAEAHGYEVNPLLVLKAKRNIARAGLSGKAFIHMKSYWDVDLGEYDAITLYGITYIMKSLGEKLRDELPKQARVVSNYFKFPDWKIKKTINGVHLYTTQ